jgi:AcrR family transcriptional regulator
MTMSAPVRVNASRQQRRARIVAAALNVAGEGYAAMHMRTVADRAGMSASTIYKYFSSKDDMLVACLQSWLIDFAVEHRAPSGTDIYQRVAHQAGCIIEQLCATPALADALARAYLYADGAAVANAESVRTTLVGMFAQVLHAVPGSRDHDIAELMADCWATSVLAVTQDRLSLRELQLRLEHTLTIVKVMST